MKEKQVQVFVLVKINKPKNVQCSKFKKLFALKNFNGGQFYREKSKFGYYINLQIMLKVV